MKKILLSCLLLPLIATAAPTVSSSIYPLQQIANAITGEKTGLVANSYLSPHTYAVTPKNAEQIMAADIVLWVGPAMMPQLDSYIDKRTESGKATITAAKLPNIHLLEGHDHDHHHDHAHGHESAHNDNHHGHDDEHKHDEHKHDEHKHDEHKHDEHKHDEHKHDEHKHDEHKHDEHEHDKHEHHKDDHHHGHKHESEHEALTYDPHLWLSPKNASVIAKALAYELIKKDATNKQRYLNNLAAFNQSLNETTTVIRGLFESHPPPPYFVFHDAYHYFEDTFGVEHEEVITAHAGQALLPKKIAAIQEKLQKYPKSCLFREPQFDAPIINKLAAENKTVVIDELDPVGYQKKDIGYPTILLNIANTLVNCSQKFK